MPLESNGTVRLFVSVGVLPHAVQVGPANSRFNNDLYSLPHLWPFDPPVLQPRSADATAKPAIHSGIGR